MSLLELLNIGTTSKAVIEEEGFPLPADSILLWDRDSELTSVPTGFTIYTDADERLIQGTTTLADAGTTGGSATNEPMSITNPGSASAGSHTGPTFNFRNNNPFPGSASGQRYDLTAGGHSHVATNTPISVPASVKPMGRYMTLITNSSEVAQIPLSCVVFSANSHVSFSRKSFDTYDVGLYTGTTTYSRARAADTVSFSVSWPSTGAHTHDRGVVSPRLDGPYTPSTLTAYPYAAASGNHSHPTRTNALTVYQQFKHLLPLMASANKPVQSGMIVMYKGASVPSGWKLCDGTNGTPDMNGFFLGYDNNETLHDVVKSNKRVDIAPAGYPLPTTNPPSPTNYEVLADFSAATVPWPHGHRGTPTITTARFLQAVYHAPGFTVPHSHPWPSANVLFPINFTPNFIKLVFIQKE